MALTLKTQLVNRGYIGAEQLAGSDHCGIVVMPGSQELVSELKKQGIIVSYRDAVRISFHFYNTKEEMHQLAEALRWLV